MPRNTQTVTSIMPRTCSRMGAPVVWRPQKSAVNTPYSKAMAVSTTKATIGTILASVTIRLRLAASRTPRISIHVYAQSSTLAQTMDTHVVPSPKIGNHRPRVEKMTTR